MKPTSENNEGLARNVFMVGFTFSILVLMLIEWAWRLPVTPEINHLRNQIELGLLHPSSSPNYLFLLYGNALLWLLLPIARDWWRWGRTPTIDEAAVSVFMIIIGTDYFCRGAGVETTAELMALGSGLLFGCIARKVRPLTSIAFRRFGTLVILLLIVLSAYHWSWLPAFYFRGVMRATGLWSNPNTFGLLSASLLVGAFGLLISAFHQHWPRLNKSWKLSRISWSDFQVLTTIIGISAGGIGLVRSYSRGALVGAVLSTSLAIWWYGPRLHSILMRYVVNKTDALPRTRRILVIGLSVGIFSALAVGASIQIGDTTFGARLMTVSQRSDRSWWNRVEAWRGASRMVLSRPIEGWGLGARDSVYKTQYITKGLNEAGAIKTNDYAVLACSLGVPGLFLFVLSTGPILVRGIKERNPASLSLLVLLVGSWFDGVLFHLSLSLPFWILWGCSASTNLQMPVTEEVSNAASSRAVLRDKIGYE